MDDDGLIILVLVVIAVHLVAIVLPIIALVISIRSRKKLTEQINRLHATPSLNPDATLELSHASRAWFQAFVTLGFRFAPNRFGSRVRRNSQVQSAAAATLCRRIPEMRHRRRKAFSASVLLRLSFASALPLPPTLTRMNRSRLST